MKKSTLIFDLITIIVMLFSIAIALCGEYASTQKVCFILFDVLVIMLTCLDLVFCFINFHIKKIEDKINMFIKENENTIK